MREGARGGNGDIVMDTLRFTINAYGVEESFELPADATARDIVDIVNEQSETCMAEIVGDNRILVNPTELYDEFGDWLDDVDMGNITIREI